MAHPQYHSSLSSCCTHSSLSSCCTAARCRRRVRQGADAVGPSHRRHAGPLVGGGGARMPPPPHPRLQDHPLQRRRPHDRRTGPLPSFAACSPGVCVAAGRPVRQAGSTLAPATCMCVEKMMRSNNHMPCTVRHNATTHGPFLVAPAPPAGGGERGAAGGGSPRRAPHTPSGSRLAQPTQDGLALGTQR